MTKFPYLLAACLFSLSWLNHSHFPPWRSWHSEVFAFASVLICVWSGLAEGVAHRRLQIALPGATLPTLGLLAIGGYQTASGHVPFSGDIWVFSFYCVICLACICLGYAAGSVETEDGESPEFSLLAWALLTAATASVLISLIQVFGLYQEVNWIVRTDNVRRPGANLAQPNHLATLQVMGAASLIYLHQSKKLSSIVAGLLLFALMAGISITESRSGALSFLILVGWWQIKRSTFEMCPSRHLGFVASIVLVVMFLAWPHVMDLAGLLDQRPQSRALEGSMRTQVWPQLVQAMLTRPWAGWGVLQVSDALNSVADQYSISEPYTYSHNIILDFAIWFGIPLTSILVVMIVIWTGRRVRCVTGLLPWFGVAITLPVLIHSMFEYPFAYSFFLAPVMFLLGAIEARIKPSPWAFISHRTAAVGALVVSLLFMWSIHEYLSIEEDFRVARFEVLNIGSKPSEYEKPNIFFFDQLGLALDAVRIKPTPEMPQQDLQKLKLAALHFPWTATQYRYAVALALNGNLIEAERQLQVMRRMWGEPTYEGVRKEITERAMEYPQLHDLTPP